MTNYEAVKYFLNVLTKDEKLDQESYYKKRRTLLTELCARIVSNPAYLAMAIAAISIVVQRAVLLFLEAFVVQTGVDMRSLAQTPSDSFLFLALTAFASSPVLLLIIWAIDCFASRKGISAPRLHALSRVEREDAQTSRAWIALSWIHYTVCLLMPLFGYLPRDAFPVLWLNASIAGLHVWSLLPERGCMGKRCGMFVLIGILPASVCIASTNLTETFSTILVVPDTALHLIRYTSVLLVLCNLLYFAMIGIWIVRMYLNAHGKRRHASDRNVITRPNRLCIPFRAWLFKDLKSIAATLGIIIIAFAVYYYVVTGTAS